MAKKLLFFVLLSIACLQGFSQAAMVMRDPTWSAEDKLKIQDDQINKLKQLAELQNQTTMAKTNLDYIIESTRKLREINRRIANFKHLEACLEYTGKAYKHMYDYIKFISKSDAFTPDELTVIISNLQSCLSMSVTSIDAVTVVITDNFSEMSDAERMANLHMSMDQLRHDLGVYYSFVAEIDILYNQRYGIRTFDLIQKNLK
jgi:hypothetical protein